MKHSFHLRKLKTEWQEPVKYYHITKDGEAVNWSNWVGKEIQIVYQNRINCIVCNRGTNKAFGEGMCYPCFQSAPEASPCILRPELCEAHLGKGRDVDWEERVHNQPHVVYLAKTSAIKVGITREAQVPHRWIDQGANEAIVIAEVPYRRLSGDIEVALKEHFTDKTSWQRMLKNEQTDLSLLAARDQISDLLPEGLIPYFKGDAKPIAIEYPVLEYPQKVKSMKLDKQPEIKGKLRGIRGQYLIFEGGNVLNVRGHSGYNVEVYY